MCEDTYECCPICEAEVLLKNAEFRKPIKCPNCGKYIMPCSLCHSDCVSNCRWESLNRDTGVFEKELKMSDLTDKWKNKELSHGAFYVRLFTGAVVVDVFDANPLRFVLYEDDIVEVLAPVPSYKELQALKEKNARQKELIKTLGSDIDELDTKKMVLIIEVNNLKCLLKECRTALETYAKEDETCGLEEENKYAKILLPKINEVLR